jgi:two-component system cell cycle sensor histidine kinase/response regulator CckA
MLTSNSRSPEPLLANPTALEELSDDAIIGMDSSGIITSWNPGAERLLGYTAVEVVGQHGRLLMPALRDDEELTNIERISRGERIDFFETLRQRKDRRVIQVAVAVSPIKDAAGRIVGVSHIARAFLDRSRSEVEFQEKQKTLLADLQASEVRYRRLFEAAQDGVLLLDAETGIIVDVNPFLGELLELSRDELVGKSLWEIGPLKDIIASRLAFQELKDKGYIRYEHLPLETVKGKAVHVEFVSNVYVSGGEKVIQCNIRDITERHRTEQALRKTETRLRHSQKMEAFGQLAAGVAHDFNNLLTVINGYAEILMGQLSKDSPHQAELDEIAKAGQRASLLTRQLLAFSRKQILEPRVLSLNRVATDMENMLRRVIGEDIELVNVMGPDPWPIRADPGQMEQVILNLAVNSRDAMPRGGKLTIETSNVELDEKFAGLHPPIRSGPHVLLSVSDTGCGMSKETQDRLFEPFFTTKGQGMGTGLGLATVYGIVKQSGGSIWVYSEPGQGSTFKIYLPRVDGPVDDSRPMKPASNIPRGHETILLAEDEAPVRKLARHILEMNGYSVLEASSGTEAIELSAGHSGDIHLLLSDMVMPGMSGAELSVHLSQLRPAMRTLFLSGYPNEAIARHGHLRPGSAFLQKPYTPSELALKIRAVIDEK